MARSASTALARRNTQLAETAKAERKKASALRRELREAREEAASTDWLGVAFSAGCGAAGSAVHGAYRGKFGKNPTTEGLLAGGMAVAAYFTGQPLLMRAAEGFAARPVSEWAESSVSKWLSAADKKTKTNDGEPATVTEAERVRAA